MKTMPKKLLQAAALAAAVMVLPGGVSAAPAFAVWLDGNTTPGGGGNAILTSLDHAFGVGDYTLVTTAQLATPGFLNSFKAVIVSRFDASFGTGLSAAAAANVQAYVGSGATQVPLSHLLMMQRTISSAREAAILLTPTSTNCLSTPPRSRRPAVMAMSVSSMARPWR